MEYDGMEEEIEIEIDCPSCFHTIPLNTAKVDYIGLNIMEGKRILFNISRHVIAICPNCGKEWFLRYHEFLALCSVIDICPN